MSIGSISSAPSPAQLAAQAAAAKAKNDPDSAQVLRTEKEQGGIELTGAALQKARGILA
jgi:hypothetical protein